MADRLVNVNIAFRNTEATEPLKNYATEKITKLLRKFVHQDTDVNVVLSVNKSRHIAEASFNADGAEFKGKEESDDLYASIDALCDLLTRQLRKNKERLTSHH